VTAIGVNASATDRVVNVTGRYIVPGFIDSHVHLAYDPVAEDLLASGIVAVLDLAAPLNALGTDHGALKVLNAGPMITAKLGYPTTSWGQGGYGLEVSSPAAGIAAVETLFAAGVQVIKVPLTLPPSLDDATVKAVVGAAHRHHLQVYTHALEDANAARAAADGVDVLAHTPTEALSDLTLDAWKTRTVISTLAAFGGGAAAVKNLHDLRERGARVLYGTDLGNTRDTNFNQLSSTYWSPLASTARASCARELVCPPNFWVCPTTARSPSGNAQASWCSRPTRVSSRARSRSQSRFTSTASSSRPACSARAAAG
jgi:hypothetical protein